MGGLSEWGEREGARELLLRVDTYTVSLALRLGIIVVGIRRTASLYPGTKESKWLEL